MRFAIKLALSVGLILAATQIGRRFPKLGGLIATMPLTSLIVLFWLYSDRSTEPRFLADYAKGALFGIGPSILFFLAAAWGLSRSLPFGIVLTLSFGAWLAGAFVHQMLLR